MVKKSKDHIKKKSESKEGIKMEIGNYVIYNLP